MSLQTNPIETPCPLCGHPQVRLHMKNPYIDDYADECVNPKCDNHMTARAILTARAKSEARRDEQ